MTGITLGLHELPKGRKHYAVADLDPQANLSAMFPDDERLVALWDDGEKSTVVAASSC